MEREPVDAAFMALLEASFDQPGYFIEVPADTAVPYWVVYPIPGGSLWGPGFGNREEAATFVYQVTSVSRRPRGQGGAQWMGDTVRMVVAGRDEGGALIHPPITGDGFAEIDRETEAPGAAEPSGSLYQVVERFRVTVDEMESS
jgi:hypothetical protein